MFGRSEIQCCLFGMTALLVLSTAPAALAGGFGIAVEIPPASSCERSHEGVLLVRPAGCRGPGASVSVTAEGLLNGRRRSVPLRLTQVSTDTYAVQRQWPTEGA